jgi:hypothetical protein
MTQYSFLLVALTWFHKRSEVFRIIILPVVLYGCETWSFILEEEYRLRVYKNRGSGRYLGLRVRK